MPRAYEPQLAIQIGRIPLRLCGEETPLYARAVQRYAAFVSAERRGLPVFFDGLRSSAQRSPLQFQLHGMSAAIAPRGAHFSGVTSEYGLDSLLRILLSVLLLPRRGFLLHAATVVRDGKAYVFMGRSGAGKSTVAALSPSGTVLTDEISLLRFSRGQWRAFGTPFWGEFRADGRNVSAPVAGVFALVQGSSNQKKALGEKDALAALLANTLFFSRDRQLRERLLAIQTQLVSGVPVSQLEFRKEEAFWEAAA